MRNTVLSCLALLLIAATISFADDSWLIRIGSQTLRPVAGSRSAAEAPGDYFVVQFTHQLNESERAAVTADGLELYRYVGGMAWLAKRSRPLSHVAPSDALIRATLTYTAAMKRSPAFSSDRLLFADMKSGRTMRAQVRFFPGVSKEQALDLLAAKGIAVRAVLFGYGRSCEIECPATALDDLLNDAAVELLDPALPPPRTTNIDAAWRTDTNSVRSIAKFRSANGSNIRVGIWDGGSIDAHPDFQDRVTIIEHGAVSGHATHVAGTIGGAGLANGNALGMAPGVRMYSYDFNGDVVSEVSNAVASYNFRITSNSWGTIAGWDYDEKADGTPYYRWVGDWMYGYYADSNAYLDSLIRSRDLLIVFAAGNERGDYYLGPHYHNYDTTTTYNDTHPNDPQYTSIPTWGNAKNNLTVGATHKDDVMTSFSSWGPTADGRLKPDVVAPGFNLLSTYLDGGYLQSSGTSMATPVVSGIAALLSDYYQRRHGADIGGLTLKTILIHGARDLGATGPDYQTGYGMVDAELSARVIRAAVFKAADFGATPKAKIDRDANMSSIIIQDSVGQGGLKSYKIVVPSGRAELRATLVWFDPMGNALINNLDLSAKVKGAALVRPLVPNPADPSAAAKPGINNRDTVERFVVENPKAGKWRIYVRGASVPQGPQDFCLIVSAGDGNQPPALKTNGSFTLQQVHPSSDSDWNAVNVKTSFASGDELWFYTYLTVPDNAAYPTGWYGTMLETWTVRNAAGAVAVQTYYSHDGFYPRPNYWRWRLGPYIVPSGLTRGTYTLDVVLTMYTGESHTASCTFTVQ